MTEDTLGKQRLTTEQSITGTLKERLERERRERGGEARLRKTRAGAERCAELLRDGPSAVEHGDLLYDERGLPK